GKGAEGDRDPNRRRNLASAANAGLEALPVRAGGRDAGTGQPVERDVVEDVLAGEVACGRSAEEGAGDLVVAVGVVIEHPGRQGDGWVKKRVADRLRPGGLLDKVAVAGRVELGERGGRGALLVGVHRQSGGA